MPWVLDPRGWRVSGAGVVARRVRPGMDSPVHGGAPAALGGARQQRTALRESPGRRAGLPRDQVTEIQRSRLLAGALAAVAEEGYAEVMVAHITRHAQVSRRTFYELFENCEACLAALVDEILALVEAQLEQADLRELGWRERVRGGLWAILTFFDREPALARMVMVEGLHGGSQVQARREQAFARLVQVIDGGRESGPRAGDCTPLTAEGVVGAAFGILYARVAREQPEPLSGLLGELMGMIVLPYYGPAAARAERARALPDAAAAAPAPARAALALVDRDPLRALPMRVTYRTARVLACIESEPGVSNREVADAAGIKDQGQVSKLLARLEHLGLLQNTGEGARAKGEANAWQLTPLGWQVAQRLRVAPGYQSEAA